MLRVVCWALAALALVAGDASGCSLVSAESLTACVRKILESSRPALKAKFDPLQLPSMSGGGNINWALENIEVHGLSDFKIQRLSVKPESFSRIAISAGLAWSKIVANMDGSGSVCASILWRKRCLTVHAKPEVKLVNPSGNLSTSLELSVVDGLPTVVPRNTTITISLPSIDVEPNMKGVVGFLNRVIGNPAKILADLLTESWWSENKGKIENKLRVQLDRLISYHVTKSLPKVLEGLGG